MRASPKTPFYVVAILAVTITNCALAQTTISGAFCWGSGGGSSLTGGSSRVVVELGVPLTLSIYGGCALQSMLGHVATITTTDIAATVAPPYVLTGSDFLPIDIGGVRYWNFSHTFSGAVIFRTPGPQTLAMTITGVDGGLPRSVDVVVTPAAQPVPVLSFSLVALLTILVGLLAAFFSVRMGGSARHARGDL